MFRKISFLLLILSVTIALISCQSEDKALNPVGNNDPDPDSDWNIPENQIFSGGVPKDGIPSLFSPETIPAAQAGFIDDKDLILGIVVDGVAKAYPHQILDWHEVVNEEFALNNFLTVSYCPLTGTAIVFDGNIAGLRLTFGVSGLLYNNNLIMFDRQTDSHWPQMRLQADQGTLRNTRQIVYPSIETSWGSWKKLFPNTVVLSTNTGHNRPYSTAGSAYPGYSNLNSAPFFGVSFLDDRLPPKQRVHGVFSGEVPDSYETKVYLIDLSQDSRLINDSIDGSPILVVDSGKDNFVVSYLRTLVDGQILTFSLDASSGDFPFTFKDNETSSTWSVLGEAITGPLAGAKLEKTKSFNAYWFAWGVFYLDAEIYQEND